MKKPLQTTLRFVGSFVIGVGSLSAVLYFVGWRSILAQMSELGFLGILSVLGTVVLAMVAWILCWYVILRSYGIHLPWGRMIGARLAGYAVSYLTPTLYFGGEPVRAFLVVDGADAPTTRIFATIIVERFLGGVSMIVFILFGGFYAIVSPTIPWHDKQLLVAGIAFIMFWIIVGLVDFAGNFKWISRAIRSLGRLFPKWSKPLGRAADKMSETEDEVWYAFTKHWKGTVLAFVIQTLATFFIYMRPQVFFFFSEGFRFDFPQLSLLFTLNILLSSFLWITPGGLGTGEAGIIGILHLVAAGITSSGAVAYSLIYKFAESIFVTLGLAYLAKRGMTFFSRKRRRRRAPSDLPRA